jgi:hypothetical protein
MLNGLNIISSLVVSCLGRHCMLGYRSRHGTVDRVGSALTMFILGYARLGSYFFVLCLVRPIGPSPFGHLYKWQCISDVAGHIANTQFCQQLRNPRYVLPTPMYSHISSS